MAARRSLSWPLFAGLVPLLLSVPRVQAGALHGHADPAPAPPRLEALADTRVELPALQDVVDVLLLLNYNTRLVVLSTLVLGIASGVVGSFLLLRKRSLMGDALSHATLPGIGILFIVMVVAGGSGKALPGLLLGATLSGLAGVILVLLIRNTSRIKDDAAMGIVLSVFFGLGVAVLGLVQSMPDASAAGLETFIYGKAASMVAQDFALISAAALLALVCSVVLLKEFTLLCFDEGYAHTLGWPVHTLDMVMLALVIAVTVIGLQAVGLILIIAFLITPAAAARFWTRDFRRMLLLAGLIGGISGWLGATLSALMPRLPAGAVVVLIAALVFLVSMFLGTERGVLVRYRAHRRLQRKIGRQDLLRAVYEILETNERTLAVRPPNLSIPCAELLAKRSWSLGRVRRLISRARRDGLVAACDDARLTLTEAGYAEAARVTRNHRLWETYLVTYADVAPQYVDRDADAVEHVLGPEMVRELEAKLADHGRPVVLRPAAQVASLQGASA